MNILGWPHKWSCQGGYFCDYGIVHIERNSFCNHHLVFRTYIHLNCMHAKLSHDFFNRPHIQTHDEASRRELSGVLMRQPFRRMGDLVIQVGEGRNNPGGIISLTKASKPAIGIYWLRQQKIGIIKCFIQCALISKNFLFVK